MIVFALPMSISLILIGCMSAFMPYISRKSSQFGVSLPETIQNGEEVKKAQKINLWMNLILTILFTVPLLVLALNTDKEEALIQSSIYFAAAIALLFLLSGLIFLMLRKKMKTLKSALPQTAQLGPEEIVVDTAYREKLSVMPTKILVSSNLLIIVFTILITWLNRETIPDVFPVNWSSENQPAVFVEKSFRTVLAIPFLQICFLLIFLIVNRAIQTAKQQLNVKKPEVSAVKNRAYRNAWSKFSVVLSILMQLLMTMTHFTSVFLSDWGITWLIASSMGFIAFVFGYIIVLSIKYGQGGERYNLPGKNLSADDGVGETEYLGQDDERWKLGAFYFNPDDPSIWIEKRYGIGITVNFGRWESWTVIIGMLFLSFLPLLFL